MKHLPHLPLALLMLPVLASPGRADIVPAPEELVRRLGDESYPVREEAGKQLLRLGVAARDALLNGVKNSDLEIRRRCRDLLPSILEADRKARLAAFVADK